MLVQNLKDKIVQVVMNNGQLVIGKLVEYVENQKLILENPQMLVINQDSMGFVPIILTKEKKPLVPVGISSINFGPFPVDDEMSRAYNEQFSSIIKPNKFLI